MDNESTHYSARKAAYPEIGNVEVRRQIGKELKSAREFQEMSLEQVMAITKINLRFLESIEEGRWNFLPPTYVKAFIRAYSNAVGLATDKLSNRLDELFRHVVVAQAPVFISLPTESEPTVGTIKVGGFWIWAEKHRAGLFYSVIATIVLVLAGFYFVRSSDIFQPTSDQADVQATQATPAQSSPDQAVKPAGDAPMMAADDSTVVSYLNLKISVSDSCTVSVSHEDSVVYTKTLWPGGETELSAQAPVKLTLTNAPSATVSVDGRQLPPFPGTRRLQVIKLGPSGQVG